MGRSAGAETKTHHRARSQVGGEVGLKGQRVS